MNMNNLTALLETTVNLRVQFIISIIISTKNILDVFVVYIQRLNVHIFYYAH